MVLRVLAVALVCVATAAAKSDEIRFVAFGDWGERNAGLNLTAKSAQSTVPNPSFVALLGDNFYPSGVQSVNDPQFKLFTELVASNNWANMKYYTILGNHDYKGNISAQVEFSTIDSRWIMPSRYYRQIVSSADGSVNICAIFLDTQRFHTDQADWLNQQLLADDCQDTDTTWRVVYGHHPIYKSRNEKLKAKHSLVALLLPVLQLHKIGLYMSGHQHDLQHIKFEEMDLIISGATSQTDAVTNSIHPPQVQFAQQGTPGYVDCHVHREFFRIDFIAASDGSLLHQLTIRKNREDLLLA